MAQDHLVLTLTPPILQALGLPAEATKLDYFAFLGLDSANLTIADVERAVIERSKILRPWQNSPTHGPEVVKLLPMLHRIAAILKDPVRREAYKKQIDKILSGQRIDPLAEFKSVVAAALADGRLDPATKAELLRYARQNKISVDDAWRIVNDVMAEGGGADETTAMTESRWEFALEAAANKGPGALRDALEMAFGNAAMNPAIPAKIMAECERFGVDRPEAERIFETVSSQWFRTLVKRVAIDGVINENQARLLLPKAGAVGIGPQRAYEMLSEFMFSSASQEEIESFELEAAGFDDNEIGQLLRTQQVVLYRSKMDVFMRIVTSGPGIAAVAILVLAVVVIVWMQTMQERQARDMYKVQAQSIAAQYANNPTPTPADDPAKLWLHPAPDPADGLVLVEPASAGDPPAFKVRSTEVTCADYQKFLVDTFHPKRPEGWGVDYSLPAGAAPETPVTNVRWADAVAYCEWTAKAMKLPVDKVRLPSTAEFKRMMQGFMPGGHLTSEPNFWKILRFTQYAALAKPKDHKALDTLYFPKGQVYDLIGNLGEWGSDEVGGLKALLGGDFAQSGTNADPNEIRYQDPEKPTGLIGFRYVVLP